MASRASIAGHPIHPMLVPIPIGLFVFSFIADLAAFRNLSDAWPTVAFYCIGGGIVGALLAAIFGTIDLLSLTDRNAKKIGIVHMGINLCVVGLFAISFALRWYGMPALGTPFILSLIGIALLLVAGWLGGHLVYRLGVAVSAPPAQSSMDRRRATVAVPTDRRRINRGYPIGQH
jgi:uncharacterized membrane protein